MRSLKHIAHRHLLPAALAGAGLVLALSWEVAPAGAAMPQQAPQLATLSPPPALGAISPVALEAGVGRVLALGADAANVFVADPKVAEVRPASANTLFVFGVGPGRTSVAAMDVAGHVLAQFEVTVRQSRFAAGEAEAAIARLMPASHISVVPQAKGILLTGRVANAEEAARAASIARGFLPDNQVIENQLAVSAQVQISLRVRIAEMNRSVVRNLGVDWAAVGTIGSIGMLPAVNIFRNNAAGVGASAVCAVGALYSIPCRGGSFDAVIDALAQDNLVRILAEPNLVAMSGEQASFLAGGEYPIPVGVQNNTITIVFKQYGVSLAFVPTVMSDGRINLHVNPEVSQLTSAGSTTVQEGTSTIVVPGLTVRRASTTVELGSGQSFAIAGLLQNTSTQNDSGLPGLGDIPVLGPLFRSDQFQRNESELVIVVTPFIVRPVGDPAQLGLPTDGVAPAGDFDRILRLRQVAGAEPGVPSRIPGEAGFIVQ
jgi:pilus assembly protein CpaC